MSKTSTVELDTRVQSAKDTLDTDGKKGVAELRQIIGQPGEDAELVKAKEQAIGILTTALSDVGDAQGLRQLLSELQPLHQAMPKAKTAKIVRNIIDALAKIPDTANLQACLSSLLQRLRNKRLRWSSSKRGCARALCSSATVLRFQLSTFRHCHSSCSFAR